MQNLPRIANWMSKAYGALSRNRFNQVASIFQSPKTTGRCGNHAVGVTHVVKERTHKVKDKIELSSSPLSYRYNGRSE